MTVIVEVITRGHHGAGLHVREKKPRQAYGPRNPAARAEWLKTDAGQAWQAARDAKATGGATTTGAGPRRPRSGDEYIASVDRIIREERAITARSGRHVETLSKRVYASMVALNRADQAAMDAQSAAREKAAQWYAKTDLDADPADRLQYRDDMYIRWSNQTAEGQAARKRIAALEVRAAAAAQALDSAQAAQAKNAADAQYVRPEADRIRDRVHEVLLEKTPSFTIESDISATASLRGAIIEGKALSFRIRAAEDFVTRIIAPKTVEAFDPTGVLHLGADHATYARGKTFALSATKSAEEGYGWTAADPGGIRYEPTDRNRESCGYHKVDSGAVKIVADRDYIALRLSDITNGYPRVVGADIRNNRELRAAAQAALERFGDMAVSTAPKPPIISVTARTTTDVLVHEIAHAIEHRSEALAAARVDFIRRRTTTADGTRNPRYWLRDVYGESSGYELYEAARLDSFEHAYAGKVYPGASRSSEVFSMGVQRLYSDPAGFRAADPDFFRFTVATLKGVPEGSRRLPGSSKKWDTSNLTPISGPDTDL